MKNLFKNFGIFFIIFILIIALFNFFGMQDEEKTRVGTEVLIARINQEEIEKIIVSGTNIEVILKDGKKEEVKKESGESFSELVNNYGVEKDKLAKLNIEVKEGEGFDYWLAAILPFLLPFLLIGVFIFIMMRSVQGANSRAMMFGQSGAKEFTKDEKNQITFKDVAGVKEAKEELYEVVEFLRSPKKFLDLGARIPRGVLLLGSPGTGKTLLARAVAGEAKVPFFHISGSEFVEMFVGVGASRVRDLFKKAKKNTPCIVFIDEIDAVGRKRGAGLGGSHDEREQTLNQILVEMDGFDQSTNIIVIAATNRPDVLDKALLRPGRFDRQVVLENPDINDREEILNVHARKKPLSKDVSLRKIGERTPGFSGADLANLLNEAAILAARRDKKIIDMEELIEAIEKVMMGPERKSRVITVKEKDITAYHEAGHAIVAHFLPNTDPVHKISIIARGQAGGYTLKLPTEDRHMHTKTEYVEEIAVLLGGFLTEKAIYGEVTTGATSDLRRATNIARRLITDFGMSDILGPRTFGNKEEMIFLGREITEQRDYSEKIAEKIDEEISGFITRATKLAEEIISSKRAMIDKVVKELLEKETIEKDRFEELMKEEGVV
ncbi:MAG: ATP-dependent zinc metalloprotease FtsH [Candidatus Falkowbacteria bacterium GW2011_GWC2_38_22]|uniref:ATP-dependent zinc metalloprotease FtsH n=1 Tax=Candidatus Falkowbacteria bacterium GW2011_GWE1_38_31 TaxID=1618638 RepID=A0A0G0JUK0_9BACT|nr:MAG: ATP-dependent zinc metalloprotease FtsH [Candidatus Falkowbacteria bacterium GW2011_GWF2_38_1205]KKQ61784.1 MAG: ATP-dependent zinc metalloprotease FtsH [Candidatus Falkowbacteria bacterium GW2011_GWC2_38_22]KKQ64092.1 MAG: ATP-dependent zinc metalloprotease FtsH [Candidatus Falkowbacteria bacterium GW2011_GWF1_38_22]KKQ66559.1 MAG: ATP-dependent zinc metalloprotease FtsH [Candidatus Falkowbacteria bacterium GW2011_GWE2_38_254]KKQ71198.1 MAG: ATP-dependent zinc metalloprotease FtsH [Can